MLNCDIFKNSHSLGLHLFGTIFEWIILTLRINKNGTFTEWL